MQLTAENLAELRKLIDLVETPYSEGDKVNRILSFCVDVTFFYRGGLHQNQDGILDFYAKSLEVLGDRAKYFLVDGEGRFKKVKKDTLEMLPFWVKSRADDGAHGLVLETGKLGGDFTDFAFQTSNYDDESGWCRLVLPVEWLLENGSDKFAKLALSLGAKLKFSSGSAGFAVNQSWKRSCTERLKFISRRFLGIEVASPHHFQRFVPASAPAADANLRSINWLTFVGDELLKRLGGKKVVAQQFADSIKVHSLDSGLAIQAGDEPSVGDVNSGEKLSGYQAVGSKLKKLIIPNDVLGPWNSIGGDEEITRQWLHRFDNS